MTSPRANPNEPSGPDEPSDPSTGLPSPESLSTAQIEAFLTEAESSLAELRAEVRQRRLRDELDTHIPATDLTEARGRWLQFADYLRHITRGRSEG
jgi:bifunctional pyridoxal-dependent enzyme with beta-cystathionase and maltose regulon repressor activities